MNIAILKAVSKSTTLLFSFAIISILSALGASSSNAESFVVDGNKALNTNSNFSKIYGQPRMSVWGFDPNDADQQFTIEPDALGGVRLIHRSTGKCLNAYLPQNGSPVNVWPCPPAKNDPDQSFVIKGVGGNYRQIQRRGTNFCLDNPVRADGGKVHLWECDRSNTNPNQRWKTEATLPPPPPQIGQITLPFSRGQTWYVCQGYNGPVSHRNTFGLDLSIGRDIGSTACYAADGNVSRSANQPIIAPAGGRISYVNTDLVCLSIDNNRSLLIGHMRDRVASGTVVGQGDVIGYVSAANSANGGFSHIHLEGRKSPNCAIGTSAPLTEANGLQLIGIGDLPASSTQFGKALTRP